MAQVRRAGLAALVSFALAGLGPLGAGAQAATPVPVRWSFLGPRVLVPQCPGLLRCPLNSGEYLAGRVNGLAWQGGALYAATANGGVWRYNVGLGRWQDQTPHGPVLATGAIAQGRGASLYVATGDAQENAGSGDGILRLRPGAAPQVIGASARVGGYRILSPTDTAALLTLAPPHGGARAILVSNAYGVFRSTDGGRTWRTSIATGDLYPGWLAPPKSRPAPLLQSAADPAVVYTDVGPAFVVSHNFGRTWSRLSTALPDWGAVPGRASLALAQSPSDPSILYASLQTQPNLSRRVYDLVIEQSRDGGRTWHTIFRQMGTTLTQFPGYSNVLSVDPRHPGNLYAGYIRLMEIQNAGTPSQRVTTDVLSLGDPFATVDIHALAWHRGALYVAGDQGCSGWCRGPPRPSRRSTAGWATCSTMAGWPSTAAAASLWWAPRTTGKPSTCAPPGTTPRPPCRSR